MLDVSDTNIPLPKHDYCGGSGYVQGKYKGLDVELCTIKLTDVTEVLRDETGLWEKNENQIYEGQWMLCNLDCKFSTWLTIYPHSLLDEQTIKTFRKFALNLNMDGKLYIAAHSGHGFENASRDELKWFRDLMDVFRRK